MVETVLRSADGQKFPRALFWLFWLLSVIDKGEAPIRGAQPLCWGDPTVGEDLGLNTPLSGALFQGILIPPM